MDQPARPFAAIVGGAKVSTKLPVLESLIDKCDKIFLGGGMIFTFYKALGLPVGSSMVEEDMIPMAKTLMDKASAKGIQFILPTDIMVSEKFAADAAQHAGTVGDIHVGAKILGGAPISELLHHETKMLDKEADSQGSKSKLDHESVKLALEATSKIADELRVVVVCV